MSTPPTLERLAALSTTRTEGALRALTKATERLRRLEVEEQAAFVEYAAAREACADQGLNVDVELTAGMAASYADWKQRRAVAEARSIVRSEVGAWPATESRKA